MWYTLALVIYGWLYLLSKDWLTLWRVAGVTMFHCWYPSKRHCTVAADNIELLEMFRNLPATIHETTNRYKSFHLIWKEWRSKERFVCQVILVGILFGWYFNEKGMRLRMKGKREVFVSYFYPADSKDCKLLISISSCGQKSWDETKINAKKKEKWTHPTDIRQRVEKFA